MPQVYNGSQSPLEKFAIYGNPQYGSSGRLWLINQTKIGTGKYPFRGPYKNPAITNNAGDKYTATHTNALSNTNSPFNGKGTGNQIDVTNTYNGVTARNNYNGGNEEDRLGVASQPGSGRNPQIIANAGLWGYGPQAIAGGRYLAPNMSQNTGQVVI